MRNTHLHTIAPPGAADTLSLFNANQGMAGTGANDRGARRHNFVQ